MAGTGDWQEGQRFGSGVDVAEVQKWVNGLGLANNAIICQRKQIFTD